MSGGVPLCAEERETISRELRRETSARGIAKLLGRHHSTIAREIDRNGGGAHYRAIAAQGVHSRVLLSWVAAVS